MLRFCFSTSRHVTPTSPTECFAPGLHNNSTGMGFTRKCITQEIMGISRYWFISVYGIYIELERKIRFNENLMRLFQRSLKTKLTIEILRRQNIALYMKLKLMLANQSTELSHRYRNFYDFINVPVQLRQAS